jgi:hypothetical protein
VALKLARDAATFAHRFIPSSPSAGGPPDGRLRVSTELCTSEPESCSTGLEIDCGSSGERHLAAARLSCGCHGKTTINRAVKSGKLSASTREDGSYEIDPAELTRAYPGTGNGTVTVVQSVTAEEVSLSWVQLRGERDRYRALVEVHEETTHPPRPRDGGAQAADRVADRPCPAPVVATVVSVTGAMRSGARIALFVGVTLIQCYATRTRDGCEPLSVHATMVECRTLAKEYGKFDTRALNITGLPAVVSYHCVAAEP